MKELKNTQQQKKFKVLLIGDNCVDEYQYGTVDRLSPEAPVPVFKKTRKETKNGMAANVADNLEKLGLQVNCVLGEFSIKTRFIDERSKQHIIRLDDDSISNPLRIEELDASEFEVDAIVISDYDKGYVTYELIKQLRDRFAGPIFLDTKKQDLKQFDGIFVKINELEYGRRTSTTDKLIITLGSDGAMYNGITYPSYKEEVADVCGCGDTFLAALTYKYLQTQDIGISIMFANKAASITVRHIGNYAPLLREIE